MDSLVVDGLRILSVHFFFCELYEILLYIFRCQFDLFLFFALVIIDKLEQGSSFIENERRGITFGPTDVAELDKFTAKVNIALYTATILYNVCIVDMSSKLVPVNV